MDWSRMIPDDPRSLKHVKTKPKIIEPPTRARRIEGATCLGDALGLPAYDDEDGASIELSPRTRPDPGPCWYRAQSTFFGDPEWPYSSVESKR